MPSFCSTMWVRLIKDTFSLQLHTAEQWIRESEGSEAKKRRGLPNMSFMIGLAEIRESAWMNVLTSFSCLSKCYEGEDDRGLQCVMCKSITKRSNWFVNTKSVLQLFLFRIHRKLFYLEMRCDDGCAHFHLPSISSLFGGKPIVIRDRPLRGRQNVFNS